MHPYYGLVAFVGPLSYGVLDGVREPGVEVLVEPQVLRVEEEAAVGVGPGRPDLAAGFLHVLAGDVAPPAVGADVGAPVADDRAFTVLAGPYVSVSVRPALLFRHLLPLFSRVFGIDFQGVGQLVDCSWPRPPSSTALRVQPLLAHLHVTILLMCIGISIQNSTRTRCIGLRSGRRPFQAALRCSARASAWRCFASQTSAAKTCLHGCWR